MEEEAAGGEVRAGEAGDEGVVLRGLAAKKEVEIDVFALGVTCAHLPATAVLLKHHGLCARFHGSVSALETSLENIGCISQVLLGLSSAVLDALSHSC